MITEGRRVCTKEYRTERSNQFDFTAQLFVSDNGIFYQARHYRVRQISVVSEQKITPGDAMASLEAEIDRLYQQKKHVPDLPRRLNP